MREFAQKAVKKLLGQTIQHLFNPRDAALVTFGLGIGGVISLLLLRRPQPSPIAVEVTTVVVVNGDSHQ